LSQICTLEGVTPFNVLFAEIDDEVVGVADLGKVVDKLTN
jgi:hypothetical protein